MMARVKPKKRLPGWWLKPITLSEPDQELILEPLGLEHEAVKHAHSDDWQGLHAFWLGLCQKVEEGTIKRKRAIYLFEKEREKTKERMRRQINTEVTPFG